MSDTNDTNVTNSTTDAMEVAFNASLADISAVPESELINVTLDAVSITTSMFGILPELRALRDQIASTWRDFDLERFDKLEQYGLALAHAHGIYNRLSAPKAGVTEKAAELTRIRDRLYSVALPLVEYGLINGSELDKCKVAVGYRPLLTDVITLVGVYKEHWPVLEGKVPVKQEELLHAKGLALELMQLIGLKEQSPVTVGEAALVRQKAFTLFLRTYEDARRAVAYLRAGKGDADDIAPSLYALRTGKRKPSEDPPVPAPAHEATGATPAPASVTVAHAVTPLPPIPIDNRAGLPIDNPFIH